MISVDLQKIIKTEMSNLPTIQHALAGPFIWMMIIPFVVLDVFIEVYQHICFPLYKIPLVKRASYIRLDRHKLEYLTPLEKVFCAYCGYANGLLHYAVEIAGRTEKYWCAVKHKQAPEFKAPKHHADFAEYGDETSFKRLSHNHQQ